jgi:transposase
MANWARAKLDRRQAVLFSPTLDERIAEDHPVRLVDEILRECDWRDWERHYCGDLGQPPIHPRVMAGAILYGLTVGVRTSRRLEDACGNRLDFIWLVEGRVIDHSTFCKFRNEFSRELKELLRQIVRVAMGIGMVSLSCVALDGTRIKANSSRHGTSSAEEIEQGLRGLDERIEKIMAEADEDERREGELFGEDGTPNRLPRAVADLKRRKEVLKTAFDAARQRDEQRPGGGGAGEKDRPARVPVSDPDARVMPNKEGGHAPNYTALAAVDGEQGIIVGAQVVGEPTEQGKTLEMVQEVEGQYGEKPGQVIADSHHGTGANLAALEGQGVEAYIPVQEWNDHMDNPARRADPTKGVDKKDWGKLPRCGRTGKLDKSAFVYDAAGDCYWCPMGRRLRYLQMEVRRLKGGDVKCRRYTSRSCEGCELAGECLKGGARRRGLRRDEHEEVREKVMARLSTEQGKELYRRRLWLCETPFAVMKGWMGIRQFLTRGIRKVTDEFLWAVTAYDLKKIVWHKRRQMRGSAAAA